MTGGCCSSALKLKVFGVAAAPEKLKDPCAGTAYKAENKSRQPQPPTRQNKPKLTGAALKLNPPKTGAAAGAAAGALLAAPKLKPAFWLLLLALEPKLNVVPFLTAVEAPKTGAAVASFFAAAPKLKVPGAGVAGWPKLKPPEAGAGGWAAAGAGADWLNENRGPVFELSELLSPVVAPLPPKANGFELDANVFELAVNDGVAPKLEVLELRQT